MRTSFKISAASGNLSFLGGPFLMPDQTKTGSSDFDFLTVISNAPRLGVRPSLTTRSNWWFGMSEHKSVKICVARRLNTCQDLQASTKIMEFFTEDVVVDDFSVTNFGISAANFACKRDFNESLVIEVYSIIRTYITFYSNGWFTCFLCNVSFAYNFGYLHRDWQNILAGENNVCDFVPNNMLKEVLTFSFLLTTALRFGGILVIQYQYKYSIFYRFS